MFNKINEDFVQSKAFFSSNCVSDVKMLWVNTQNNSVLTISLNSLIYSMKFNYELNRFSTAEIILNDTSEKLIDRNIYLNNGNNVAIKIITPSFGEFIFSGRIVVFKCIDVEHGLYYLKLYSDWNYFNVRPAKVRLGLYNENGMTFTTILNSILYYQLPSNHNKKDKNSKEDDNIPLFDSRANANSYVFISNTDNEVRLKSFIVPNWDLEETLNYIVPFCSSSTEKTGDFVWYENTDGLYITSIDDMYLRGKRVPTTKFFINIFQQNNDIDTSANGEVISPYVIYDYEFHSGYDTIDLKDNHAGGMNNVMFDYENKKVVQSFNNDVEGNSSEFYNINSKISTYLNRRETFYDKPLLDNNLNSDISYNDSSNEYREFGNNESRFKMAQSYANNKITKSLFNNYNLVIKTNFNPSISIGSFVYIDYPTIANSKGESIKDYSGVWMVVKAEYAYESTSSVDGQPFYYSIFTLARDSKYSDVGAKFEKTNKTIQ